MGTSPRWAPCAGHGVEAAHGVLQDGPWVPADYFLMGISFPPWMWFR